MSTEHESADHMLYIAVGKVVSAKESFDKPDIPKLYQEGSLRIIRTFQKELLIEIKKHPSFQSKHALQITDRLVMEIDTDGIASLISMEEARMKYTMEGIFTFMDQYRFTTNFENPTTHTRDRE